MSKENAKAFYDEVTAKGETDKWRGLSADQMNEIIAKEGYDFTLDEIKEVVKGDIMCQELSDDELDMVSGGGADGGGGCTQVFYEQHCQSTVEPGSWCGSGDYCEIYSETYDCVLTDTAMSCDVGMCF